MRETAGTQTNVSQISKGVQTIKTGRMPSDSGPCFVCLKVDETEKCEACLVFFCRRHKVVHRGEKGTCFPYKVKFRGNLGRILVATRNIKKGEVICREVPAIVGPYSRSKPQCLQCFKLIQEGHEYFCEGCGFPMCNVECGQGRYHMEECKVFREAGVRVRVEDAECFDVQYSAISVLRLLMLLEKEKLAEKAGTNIDSDYLLGLSGSLMDHNQERREAQPEIWQFEEECMVDFIQKKCKLADRFSAEEIHSANGRIMMNATSLELPETGYGRGAGLFPIYSMMNTSCRNNTKSKVLPDHSVEILAKVKIKAGEEITNQYMTPDKPTFIRRPIMKEKWFFDCTCPRCCDPTELGSHFSSLLCTRQKCGGPVVSSNPLDNLSNWTCQLCDALVSLETIRNTLETSEALIGSPAPQDGPVEHFERVLHNLAMVLHPGNYLLLDVKQKLGLMYGNIMPYTMNRISTPVRERKIQLCHDVMESLSKLESGLSPWHIAMLTELAKIHDPDICMDNQDPGGRKGMMLRFLLKDKMLTGATCLQLLE
eukprot:GFUD01031534.1.p1 GENE.GFUD01031534.1~~GFUD01031534.1.p1  ORF type:complete len:540 (+),score=155.73 GFUD01031534.1:1-1620(+)